MTGWLAFLVTLSLIILVHEWGHFAVARRIGVKVERFSFGFGPRLVGVVRGGTDYCVCLFPLGGYVKLAGETAEGSALIPPQPWEYRGRSVGQRALIVLAGPLVNYALGFLLFLLVFLIGAPVYTARVGKVLEGYPAAAAGLRPGDRVLAVDGVAVETWEEMTALLRAKTGPITLALERQGQRLDLGLTPRLSERKNLFGGTVRVALIGITPFGEVQTQRYPLGAAVWMSVQRIGFLTGVTLQALWRIATGGLSPTESITGPIGIFYLTASVAAEGWAPLFQLIAVLSTSIGLFNLLPLPVLDGGHLVFLGLERMRGRPVPARAQEVFYRLGLVFLLMVLVVVTYNDLIRFEVADRFLDLISK